jgi:alkyl sulfatase BDS1-like metallo-beta-lactamase superfamily hydrolase
LTQGHGKVSWAVKSIWEYYATWFHFESTTELYHVPARDVYADLGELAGSDALVARAAGYRSSGQCLRALHLLEVALAASPDLSSAWREQAACLQDLLVAARILNNSYEVMWLEAELVKAQSALTIEAF